MSDSNAGSFAEKARAMFAKEDAEKAKGVAAHETAERRRERLAAEGPAVYQKLTAEIAQHVKAQIEAVGRVFSLPAHSQKGAEVEVVVRDKWLLTVRFSGLTVTLDVYNLAAQNNPRMRDESDSQDHSRYQLELNNKELWQWKYEGGSAPRVRAAVFSPSAHAPSNLTNEALVAHILDKALGLANEDTPRKSGNGFQIF